MRLPVRRSPSLKPTASGSSGQYRRTRNSSKPDPRPSERPFDTKASDSRQLVRILLTAGSDMLESAHDFLSAYLMRRLSPQVAQRMSVAAYELVANALSYGAINEDIAVEIWRSADHIAIRVSNQTIGARISMLNDLLRKLRTDADATLVSELRRSVGGGSRPMLGLSRVMHEVGLRLDVDVEGTRLTITASGRS